MGLSINQEDFSEQEYTAFSARLYECLSALKQQIQSDNFGLGTQKIGAELEMYIVDQAGDVLPLNTDIIQRAKNSCYTVELNRFNLEINFDPINLGANSFSQLQQQLLLHQKALRELAAEFNADLVPIGILPTLMEEHLSPAYMTDIPRYRALSKHLLKMRGEEFKINIQGEDDLALSCNHVGLEGANTSFQFHLMVNPKQFVNIFNAIQLITPLTVAVAANSPILLNKLLWDETRITLFKQSIDSRSRNSDVDWRKPSRVSFGNGWVRENAWELFAEAVALYPPIFPILSKENPMERLNSGKVPKLEELSLHMGTTWPWNRPVYSSADGGHVRIEMRSLPAGPSNIDMCANAAFAAGVAVGLGESIQDFLAIMPFRFAEYNFYRAAQSGLDASIIWTNPQKHQPIEMPIVEVIEAMLPVATRGLITLGIEEKEINYYLATIEQRIGKKMTGARWQRQVLKHFETKNNRQQACKKMFQFYRQQQATELPICEWQLP